MKVKHQKPARLLQPIEIPQSKWEVIIMDFVTRLPKTLQRGMIQFRSLLTKSTHVLHLKTTYSTTQHDKLFLDEIVSLHGVPISIILNRGTQFIS